jgi:hypothetical protein
MVCFCDIPLSQVRDHINTYGKYGLGISKAWGKRKGLNPVIYLTKNSRLSEMMNNVVEAVIWSQPNPLQDAYMEMMNYVKPYTGPLRRNGRIVKKSVRFYDEREWRYVPSTDVMKSHNIEASLQRHVYQNPAKMANANSRLQLDGIRLQFKPADIKYIIVDDEPEILTMVRALKNIKGTRYDTDTIELLTSRITTTKQILNDF